LARYAFRCIFFKVRQVLSHLRNVVDFVDHHCDTEHLYPLNVKRSNLVLVKVFLFTNKNLAQEVNGATTYCWQVQLALENSNSC
jgi:hypothetical protein